MQGVLDYSANINPLGLPKSISAVLKSSLPEIKFYPEPYARSLRQSIAEYYGVLPQEVIIGNGAAELIFLFCRALGKINAFLPAPTFSEYALACRANGGEPFYFWLSEKDNFIPSAADLVAGIKAQEKRGVSRGGRSVLFLCNPNNPTGQILTEEESDALFLALRERRITLFLDLSFLGFMPGKLSEKGALPVAPVHNFKGLLREKCLEPAEGDAHSWPFFLLFSFTKLFALPGLRLGYGIGPRKLIEAMERQRDPWSVNTLAQRAGERCLWEREYVLKSVALVERERKIIYRELSTIKGVKLYPSAVNFMLCNLRKTGIKAAYLVQKMAEKEILIRDASNFPGLDPYYVRLAVRLPEENKRLIKAMKEIMPGG